MTGSATELLTTVRAAVSSQLDRNRLVPAVVRGETPLTAIAALAAEEHHIVASDTRSFLHLAARADGPATTRFFTTLALGELLAAPLIPALAAAAGLDAAGLRDHRPTGGCQAYPAYVAWLALNADPAEAVLAMTANFAAWGGYCAALSAALRKEYGFDDTACAFFDFFAGPSDLEAQAVEAIQASLDSGRTLPHAEGYALLLHHYELLFWNTLASST
jgi:hypothetical protein